MWIVIYLMCVDSNGHPKSTGQAKISQFYHPFVINKQVLWLQIAMQNSTTMTEQNPLQDLIQVALRTGDNTLLHYSELIPTHLNILCPNMETCGHNEAALKSAQCITKETNNRLQLTHDYLSTMTESLCL